MIFLFFLENTRKYARFVETAKRKAAACVFVLSSLFSLIVRRFFFFSRATEACPVVTARATLLVTV